MIDEKDVKYGDVFIWQTDASNRRIMFVGWSDREPGDEGQFWMGLDLHLRNNGGEAQERRGFRAISPAGVGWERIE